MHVAVTSTGAQASATATETRAAAAAPASLSGATKAAATTLARPAAKSLSYCPPMRTIAVVCLLLPVALGFLACGGPLPVQQLRSRFAFETDCPEQQITTVELRAGSSNPGIRHIGAQYGVSGCGRRAVYVYSNHGWLNDTSGETSGGEEDAR
jgi:hypothetical protein